MSALLALRLLEKSLKPSPRVKAAGKLLKYKFSFVSTTQCLFTKTNITATKTPALSQDEWRIIYRLPLIQLASAFNRVKVPYGMVNGVIIPAASALEQASQLPPSTALLVGIIGVTSWCTLAISSLFIRNLIGLIYINDNNDKLKLAYVDYWGQRNDVCVELNDVVQDEKKSKPKFDLYQTLCLYSNDKVKYNLLHKLGSIEDPETFAAIFGE